MNMVGCDAGNPGCENRVLLNLFVPAGQADSLYLTAIDALVQGGASLQPAAVSRRSG